MRIVWVALSLAVMALPFTLAGQPGLKFEATSIRPAEFPNEFFAAGFRVGASGCDSGKFKVSGTLVALSRISLCDLVRLAYGLKSHQVVGVPPKFGFSGQGNGAAPAGGGAQNIQEKIALAAKEPNIFYDIEARAPGGSALNDEQVREMLRDLLADRFHLMTHREKRELAFFALVEAKGGAKLKAAVEGCNPRGSMSLMAACGRTIEDIANSFASYSGGIVVDMTGLGGKYDYQIPIDRGDGDFRAAMMAAMQERLGLRLEQRKGPIEVLVVDRAEAPSGN